MHIEPLTRLTLTDEEMSALYEVCASALEHDLLDGIGLAFALAIVETFKEQDEMQVDEIQESEEITIQ